MYGGCLDLEGFKANWSPRFFLLPNVKVRGLICRKINEGPNLPGPDGFHFKILKHHHLLWLKLMNRDRGAILIVRDTKFKGVWGLGGG